MREAELEVLHCDNHVLAVLKPAGLPTVPDASGDASLLDLARAWLAREFRKPGNVFLGVVHRLDRPVSGVLVFGRTSKGAARLTEAFRGRAARKRYWGVGHGYPRGGAEGGELEQLLWKDRPRNTVRVVDASREGDEGVRRARTTWRVLERAGAGADGRCLLELEPHTGRPHQLRVAAASLGCPLLGDLRYGADAPLPDRSVALHALELELPHPTRPGRLRVAAPPPGLAAWEFEAVHRARATGPRAELVEDPT